MLVSAPSLFGVHNPLIAALCIAGATFEAVYSWLDEDPKIRLPAAEVARAVARFNTQAVKEASSCETRNEIAPHALWITKSAVTQKECPSPIYPKLLIPLVSHGFRQRNYAHRLD